MERYYSEDLSDESDTEGLATLGEAIDVEVFSQVLEMDDDEIECEFTRSAVLGILHGMEETIKEMQETL